jgi:ABC-2 type transport system permease protein
MTTFAWLIRRELWENRGIYLAPMIVGLLQILACLVGHVEMSGHHIIVGPSGEGVKGQLGGLTLFATGWLFGVVMIIYGLFYLADALYGDRKDRSILFWKSLPVTDGAVVLSKLATALLVIPVVFLAVGSLTGLIASTILSLRLGGAGLDLGLWLQFQVLWVYLLVGMALWYLPLAGWLLVVSAWARRGVLFWAIFPPLALALVERLFLGSSELAHLFRARLVGFGQYGIHGNAIGREALPWVIGDGSSPGHPTVLDAIDLQGLVTAPALWGGVVVGIALIAGAIALRRHRLD